MTHRSLALLCVCGYWAFKVGSTSWFIIFEQEVANRVVRQLLDAMSEEGPVFTYEEFFAECDTECQSVDDDYDAKAWPSAFNDEANENAKWPAYHFQFCQENGITWPVAHSVFCNSDWTLLAACRMLCSRLLAR